MEEKTMEAQKVEEVKAEDLPTTSDSSGSDSMMKNEGGKGNSKKFILIGCGVLLLIALCIGCFAAAAATGGAFSFATLFQNSADIVEYNNNLVDERDQAIEVLYDTTNEFYYALDLSEISDSVDTLNTAISDAETAMNSYSTPSGADEIKTLNDNYVAKLKEISAFIEKTVDESETVYDISDTTYDEFQTLLEDLDELNIQIAEKLNETVGYEAVPQSEIDKLKN